MNDLKKVQGTEVIFKNVVVSEKITKEIKTAKLKSHGIIGKDKNGKLVQILNGHDYGEKAVKGMVATLLGAKQPAEDKVKLKKPSLTFYYYDQ